MTYLDKLTKKRYIKKRIYLCIMKSRNLAQIIINIKKENVCLDLHS